MASELHQRGRCNVCGLAVLSSALSLLFIVLLLVFALDPTYGGNGFDGSWSNYVFGILGCLSVILTIILWIRYGCWGQKTTFVVRVSLVTEPRAFLFCVVFSMRQTAPPSRLRAPN